MKINMGSADRIVRVVVALGLILSIVLGWLSGALAVIAGVLAVVFLATAAIRVCPLYLPFGIRTIKKG